MNYLMNIEFSNSRRLWKNTFYFEYKDIRFKLIQKNRRKWCDVLLTIVSGYDNRDGENAAYIAASEFFSALSWQNDSRIDFRVIGGSGVLKNFRLRNAKPGMQRWPRIPLWEHLGRYDICRIPKIETEEQKDAIILLRQASNSKRYNQKLCIGR